MLTAPYKLKQWLIHAATDVKYDTREEIDEHFCDVDSDTKEDLRSGTHETGLRSDYDRHYEAKAVAAQMLDGSWVGWTYWYGGGKYGEPRSIPWIEGAYNVTATEETRVVMVFALPPKE